MKRTIVMICALCLIALSAWSQTPTYQQQTKINSDILTVVNAYATSSNMAKPKRFVRLFTSERAKVYNDLLGLSREDFLTVQEYSQLMSEQANTPAVKIRNLRRESLQYIGEQWTAEVSFEKELNYTDPCGVLFSAEEFYGGYHTIRLTLVWNEDLSEVKISKITGSRPAHADNLDRNYQVIQESDERDKYIRIDGKSMEFNSFGQVFINPNGKVTYVDNVDTKVTKVRQSSDCDVYSFKYKLRSCRLKIHADIQPYKPYSFKSSNPALVVDKSSVYGGGLDFGYMVPSRSKFQFGIFFGAGVMQGKLNLMLPELDYAYSAGSEADKDGDAYMRYYQMRDLKQQQTFLDLAVPVYFDFNIIAHRYVSIYFDLGIKNYLNITHSVSNMEGTYSTYGIYSKYDNLRLDHTWDSEQFASEGTPLKAEAMEPKVALYSLDVFGQAGVRVCLYDPLYLDLGVGYQYSVLKPYNTDEADHNLATYTVSGGEKIKPLFGQFNSAVRQALNVQVGLILKF